MEKNVFDFLKGLGKFDKALGAFMSKVTGALEMIRATSDILEKNLTTDALKKQLTDLQKAEKGLTKNIETKATPLIALAKQARRMNIAQQKRIEKELAQREKLEKTIGTGPPIKRIKSQTENLKKQHGVVNDDLLKKAISSHLDVGADFDKFLKQGVVNDDLLKKAISSHLDVGADFDKFLKPGISTSLQRRPSADVDAGLEFGSSRLEDNNTAMGVFPDTSIFNNEALDPISGQGVNTAMGAMDASGGLGGAFGEGFRSQFEEMRLNAETAANAVGAVFGQTFNQLSADVGSAVTDVLFYGKSWEDAGKQILRSLLANIVGGLVQVAARMAINFIIGRTFGAAATAAAAGEAAAVSALWATPAALVSLATFGANAAPAIAGITTTVGFSHALAAVPGFADGGIPPVGRDFLVGENGPEILRVNQRSRVIPNDEIGSELGQAGSGSINVNVSIRAFDSEDVAEFLTRRRAEFASFVVNAVNEAELEAAI